MNLGLSGHLALVTASSRGLGAAIAEELSQEGARVIISARSSSALRETADAIRGRTRGEVHALVSDGTDWSSVGAMVESVENSLGPIDILVNSSGGPPTKAFAELSDEDWHEALDIKLLMQIRYTRAILPRMVARRFGRIVNVVGTHGLVGHAYAVTAGVVNAALLNLTKALAEEAGPANVTVNAVNPGPIATERMIYLCHEKARALGISYDEAKHMLTDELIIRRFGTPQEVAAAVTFLVSSRASFITGALLNVDGGMVRSI